MMHTLRAHDESYLLEAPEGTLINQRIEETGEPYEVWLLEDIYKRSRGWDGGCAVDVGAHIGNHTLWIARVCGVPVVAFEPLMAHDLKKNVLLNSLDSVVRIEEYALGGRTEWASDLGMRVLTGAGAPRGPGTAEGKLKMGEGEIPVRTLDSFDLHNVRMVKVDVEGMEPDVLEGAKQTLRTYTPVVYAEAPTEEAHMALAAVLHPMGYRKVARFKRGTPVDVWEWRRR